MNDCAAWRETLDVYALGGELPDAARAHLQSCGDCAAELERRRALVGRFDAVVGARANAQPSSDFNDRVRLRLARDAGARPTARAVWRPALTFVFGLIVIALLARTAFAPHANVAQLESWRSPTAALLQPVRYVQ